MVPELLAEQILKHVDFGVPLPSLDFILEADDTLISLYQRASKGEAHIKDVSDIYGSHFLNATPKMSLYFTAALRRESRIEWAIRHAKMAMEYGGVVVTIGFNKVRIPIGPLVKFKDPFNDQLLTDFAPLVENKLTPSEFLEQLEETMWPFGG